MYRIAIIGAGASGLMLASTLKDKRGVALIDGNSQIGEKIKISGGGRCNISNRHISPEHYSGDNKFISSILKNFSIDEVYQLCKKFGFRPRVDERHVKGSLFCNSSKDLLSIFQKSISGVHLRLNHKVLDVSKVDNIFHIETSQGLLQAYKVVLASGGLSYPKIGATDIAFRVAEKFGHRVERPTPALVGFTVQPQEFWFKELSGLSIKAKGTVGDRELYGDMLFTHKGCSGPLILNLSLYWQKGEIYLDLLPEIELQNILKGKAQISTALPLPKRFTKEFLKAIGLKDKNIHLLSKSEIEKLSAIKNYKFSPAGNFGFSRAEITRGGVSTDEVDSKTMMSKLEENLYFLGETLNVGGELGGYNFHFAFATAKSLTI
jgi:predicted Rossmann fold flavoprotein